MSSVRARLRSYWHGLRKPAQLDADMADEMRFHLEMETQRLMSTRGLDADQARRQAAIGFGGVEKYRGAARDALRFTWARGLCLAHERLSLAPEIAVGGGPLLTIWVCVGVAVFMAIVSGLACTIPARRALRIQPIETLKTT